LIYSLAALHASVGHKDAAMKFLAQAVADGGTNAAISARIDPRFASLREDPRFEALLGSPSASNTPAGSSPANTTTGTTVPTMVNKPPTNPGGTVSPKPVKK